MMIVAFAVGAIALLAISESNALELDKKNAPLAVVELPTHRTEGALSRRAVKALGQGISSSVSFNFFRSHELALSNTGFSMVH